MENHRSPAVQDQSTFSDIYESFDQVGPSTPHRRSTSQSAPSTPVLRSATNLETSPLPPPGLAPQSALKRTLTQDLWASQEHLANGHSRFGSGIEEVQQPNGKSVLRSTRSNPVLTRENTVRERRFKDPLGRAKLREQLRKIKDNSKKLCHLGHFFKAHRVYFIFHQG